MVPSLSVDWSVKLQSKSVQLKSKSAVGAWFSSAAMTLIRPFILLFMSRPGELWTVQ